ncbi:DUF4345 domain-containing protein [Fulvivirga maritima]|uniref:DUF4345 family protein n=1 Tax=Fulvivirga maritima TaxID=2904247 RepID=UPI001F2C9796|nr:DUF4345 family protein [Fulvivirga maritima]UII25977.1 DUF4345 domain-containing protein [Fulvivirga maritima]
MKGLSYFLFYTYVGLVVVAGFWGAFINPYYDFRFLFDFNLWQIPENQRTDLLSQYRFLRALELGYGIFSIIFFEQIFKHKLFNRLFLGIMLSGVVARFIAILFDGIPGRLFLFFMTYELLGVIIIFLYTKGNLKRTHIKYE